MLRLLGVSIAAAIVMIGCSESTPTPGASLDLKVLEVKKTTFIDPIVADVPNLFVAVHVSLENVSLDAAAPLNPTRFSVTTNAAVVYRAAPVETLQFPGGCDPNVSVGRGGVTDCWVVFKLTETTVGNLTSITYTSLPPIYAPDAVAKLDLTALSFAEKCESAALASYVSTKLLSNCEQCLLKQCDPERTAADYTANGCGTNAIYKCNTAPYCDCERAAFLTPRTGGPPGTECPGVYDPLQACLIKNCARACQL